jgi:hypothetical protein
MLLLLVGERLLLPSDPRLIDLQNFFETKRKKISKRRDAYRGELGDLTKQFQALTGPIIREGLKRLTKNLSNFEIKREILDKRVDGFNNRVILRISTNEDSICEAKQIIQKGIDELQRMIFRPISEIQRFVQQIESDFRQIDLSKMTKKEIAEGAFFPSPSADKSPESEFIREW